MKDHFENSQPYTEKNVRDYLQNALHNNYYYTNPSTECYMFNFSKDLESRIEKLEKGGSKPGTDVEELLKEITDEMKKLHEMIDKQASGIAYLKREIDSLKAKQPSEPIPIPQPKPAPKPEEPVEQPSKPITVAKSKVRK